MCNVLVAEEAECREDRVRCSLTEAAEGVCLDVLAELLEAVEVFQFAVAAGDLVKDLIETLGTDPARCALTAGFVHGELQEELCDIDHAVILIENDETAGTDHAADLCEAVVIDADVIVLSRDASAGRTAGLCSLKLLAVRDAAADFLDDLAERGAHRDLNEAGVLDLAAECKDLGALCSLGTHGSIPLCTLEDDLRNVCIGLNVVENGRLLIEALFCRERRTRTRLTAVALDRGHQSSFLTADECACTETEVNIEVEAGAEDIGAEHTGLSCLLDRDAESLDSDRILSTDIDIALLCADCITCNGHRFEDDMRVAFEHGTVHKCTGVALVSVAAYIFNIGIRDDVACELPFHTGREAAAASAAQTGIEDFLNDLFRRHRGQDLVECPVAVSADVFIDIFRIDQTAVAECNTVLLCIECCFVE